MPRRKEPTIPNELLDQLLSGSAASAAFDQGGLLDSLKKALTERALNAEMDHHLAGDDGVGNTRNGYGRKTVMTETGKLAIEVPRDRQASFDPQLIAKYQRRFPGFDDKIVSMYARGMSTREITGHLHDLYGIDVSPDLISTVTDAVLDEIVTWQQRPLDPVYARFSGGGNLAADFRTRFSLELDEATLNASHQIVIVAASLDASSERIVGYLNKRDIPINVLCFQVFDTGQGQLLSRAWLLDPVETQAAATVTSRRSEREPWNGEFYVSFGDSDSRCWDEARRYGFISAGGGSWYSGTLSLLNVNDRVWVRVPQRGYVGVGRVLGKPEPANEYLLPGLDGEPRPALEVLTEAKYHREFVDDPERAEYFVPVE